jgi:hypothetical protein
MKKEMWAAAAGVSLLLSTGITFGQLRQQSPLSLATPSPGTVWDASLAGKWTYRSYLNRANVIVNADPDPAVQALVPIYGQGIATAELSTRAFSLIFGEGIMTFDPPSGNAVTGTFDMGGGYVLDLKGTMQTTASGDTYLEIFGTGRAGTKTDNWEYDYRGWTTPKWPNGVNQIPSIVGTVIRAKPHDGGAAGVVASFIAIKQ